MTPIRNLRRVLKSVEVMLDEVFNAAPGRSRMQTI